MLYVTIVIIIIVIIIIIIIIIATVILLLLLLLLLLIIIMISNNNNYIDIMLITNDYNSITNEDDEDYESDNILFWLINTNLTNKWVVKIEKKNTKTKIYPTIVKLIVDRSLPVQYRPLEASTKPSLHLHSKLPGRLIHSPLRHRPDCIRHSSTSVNQNTVLLLYTVKLH